MKRSIVALMAFIALAGGMSAYAADETKINANAQAMFDKLPADKQAEMLSQMAAAQKQTEQAPVAVAETVDKWVDLGEKVGKMMGGAAKEIGIAVNEFVKTDVGRWTMVLIIWNYMGADMVDIFVHIGGALMLWLIGFVWLWYAVRKGASKTITYDETKTNIFGNYRIKEVHRGSLSDGDATASFVFAGILLVIGVLMMLNTL